jgi:hypothetical protein
MIHVAMRLVLISNLLDDTGVAAKFVFAKKEESLAHPIVNVFVLYYLLCPFV